MRSLCEARAKAAIGRLPFATVCLSIRLTQAHRQALFRGSNPGQNVGRDLLEPRKQAHSIQAAPRGHPVHVSHKCSEWIIVLLAYPLADANPLARAAQARQRLFS